MWVSWKIISPNLTHNLASDGATSFEAIQINSYTAIHWWCFISLQEPCRTITTNTFLPYFWLAFEDEELPDYIMVMVANKKNAQQMADDLSLFLGNNTIKFTVWYVRLLYESGFSLSPCDWLTKGTQYNNFSLQVARCSGEATISGSW